MRLTEQLGGSIEVALDEGETLGHFTGPATIYVPPDPANKEYAKIVELGIEPDPYVPPEPPKEDT